MSTPITDVLTRFWRKVRKTDSCWLWTGTPNRDGYGRFRYGLSNKYGGVEKMAHRVSWELANGAIPEGMVICHKCDNPPCVNPDHLFMGTSLDNSRDRDQKGRTLSGERNPISKLTWEKVSLIRTMRAAGSKQQPLADMFGVSQAVISDIVLGKRWTNSPLNGRVQLDETSRIERI